MPAAHSRVPTKKKTAGTTIADDEAISENTPIPTRWASPEAPRSEKAVMWVPKSDISSTKGPMVRVARK